MLQVAFGEQKITRTQGFEWFFQVQKPCDFCTEGAKHLGLPPANKTDTNVDHMKKHSSQTDKSLTVKLITCWEIHLGPFRTFKKTT
jgi:hypothetical protein